MVSFIKRVILPAVAFVVGSVLCGGHPACGFAAASAVGWAVNRNAGVGYSFGGQGGFNARAPPARVGGGGAIALPGHQGPTWATGHARVPGIPAGRILSAQDSRYDEGPLPSNWRRSISGDFGLGFIAWFPGHDFLGCALGGDCAAGGWTLATIGVTPFGRGITAARGAADIIKIGDYALTRTVAGKLAERPYLNSPLTLREIMAAGRPIPDPGGVAGALRWDVPGTFRGSAGTWELVIDPQSRTVLHWLFKSAP